MSFGDGDLHIEVEKLKDVNGKLCAEVNELQDRIDELEAGRTCEMEYQTDGMQRGWWKCSACGGAMDTIESCGGRKPPRFCGNCGAKVVS